MAKYYVEVEGLPIKLDTKLDLSTAVVQEIHWKDPAGNTGEWTGTVTETTKVLYSTVAGNIPAAQFGMWEFLAYIELASGFKSPGEPVSIYFNPKWE